jgi:hypothetical protein
MLILESKPKYNIAYVSFYETTGKLDCDIHFIFDYATYQLAKSILLRSQNPSFIDILSSDVFD